MPRGTGKLPRPDKHKLRAKEDKLRTKADRWLEGQVKPALKDLAFWNIWHYSRDEDTKERILARTEATFAEFSKRGDNYLKLLWTRAVAQGLEIWQRGRGAVGDKTIFEIHNDLAPWWDAHPEEHDVKLLIEEL